jgi:hypothetical protein
MADWLAKRGCEPIFIDNNSDYPPLLEYYRHCPYCVIKINANYGNRVVWNCGILDKLGIKENYVVTDPDLDLTGIPDDFLQVLEEGLRRYPEYSKIGFSLEINDLPQIPSAELVKNIYESVFWKIPLDDQYFHGEIDTTFALHTINHPLNFPDTLKAIRTNRPYTARHVPWYYDHIKDLPEDEQYYFNTANADCSGNIRIRR